MSVLNDLVEWINEMIVPLPVIAFPDNDSKDYQMTAHTAGLSRLCCSVI